MSLNIPTQVTPVVTVGVAPVVTPVTPVTPNKPVIGTPEYDAAMAQVAREARGEVENDETLVSLDTAKSPSEGIPDKFLKDGQLDTESLLKSYRELEAKLSGGKTTEVPPVAAPVIPPVTTEVVAGIPVEQLAAEVAEKGDLTKETRDALTAKGIPGEYIDSYLKMFQAAGKAEEVLVAQKVAEIKAVAGGDEGYSKLVQWASVNLKPNEIAAYDSMVDQGGDISLMAVSGLKARYESSMGTMPSFQVSGTPSGKTDVFTDKAEFMEAMADPQYSKSEAYRNRIMSKLGRTRNAGIGW